MTWQVRPAAAPDIPLLPGVERAAARVFPPGRIPDPDETHSLDEFARWAESGLAWVAVDGTRVVGFVVAAELDNALHVVELAVDPQFGRRGIGTALMKRIMAEAAARRQPRVTLTTFEDLPWNAPFYRRLGFEVLHAETMSGALASLLEAERRAGLTRRVAMARPVTEVA